MPDVLRSKRLTWFCAHVSLALAAALPFLIPFDAARNIDLQGGLLLVSGAFAWIAIIMGRLELLRGLNRTVRWLLASFLVLCFASLIASHNYWYGFFGAPYVRLGAGGFLACAGIGLITRALPEKRLLIISYGIITGLAVVAAPYTLWRFHSLLRVGGSFSQADILACFLGSGLILGLWLMAEYPRYRAALLSIQAYLLLLLLLTQTRAILLLVFVLAVVWSVRRWERRAVFQQIAVYGAVGLMFLGMHFSYARLADVNYVSQSIHYRLALQDAALSASVHRPVLGYGPGNITDALKCPGLKDDDLRETCREGYYFNSSHNIFLDRVLAVGWIGGLAFFSLVVSAIYWSIRNRSNLIPLCVLLLISGYYLTNVTAVTLELLFWIFLLRCFNRA